MEDRSLPRGTVTFLFTDIEGSTRLVQELGPAWPPVLEDHNAVLRESVKGEGGTVVRTEGDSVFAVFSSAPAAVAAAVRAQRELGARAWPAPVRVRMGLHTGEGHPGGDDYVGLDVHRAARVAAAGHGGQVLISETTRALVEHHLPAGVSVRALGRHRLKDLPQPEELSDLVVDGLATEFPPPTSLDVPSNLPTPLTSFVGRGPEMRRIRELLREARMVTLTGPGGSGKTRLAVEAASGLVPSFPDGVFFVDLAPITDPGLLHPAIARSIGVREVAGRPIRASVEDAIRDRELLLLLDNFEQIIGAAPLVTDLLRGAPRLRVLVTSRAALRVSGEQELPVPPLGIPDPANVRSPEALFEYEAVALFVQRGAAVAPGFTLTPRNAAAIAEVCTRLDGLPLAIELAASRVKLISPADMVGRLEDRLGLLTGGARDLPARQRTLRETIRWSYDLLEATEQRLLARLSAFVDGWTLEAAEAVVNPNAELGIDTLDGLGSLADNSLIGIEPGLGEVRFDMLQTIREFGTKLLAESGEEDAIRRRHVAYFRALAERAMPELTKRDEGWLDRLDHEHANFRAAMRWSIDTGEAESALLMAWALWRFWLMRDHLGEGRRITEELLALPSARRPSVARARGLSALGGLAYWQREPEQVARLYEEALALSRDLGDRLGEAEGTYNLSFALQLSGDLAGAAVLLRRAVDLYRELGDEINVAFAKRALAMIELELGDHRTAKALVEEALRTFRRHRVLWGIVQAAGMSAALAMTDHDLARALPGTLESLDANVELGHTLGICVSLQGVAVVAILRGSPEVGALIGGAIERIREQAEGEAPPGTVGLADPRELLQTRLPAERLAKLWDEGRTLALEEAVEAGRAWLHEAMGAAGPAP